MHTVALTKRAVHRRQVARLAFLRSPGLLLRLSVLLRLDSRPRELRLASWYFVFGDRPAVSRPVVELVALILLFVEQLGVARLWLERGHSHRLRVEIWTNLGLGLLPWDALLGGSQRQRFDRR